MLIVSDHLVRQFTVLDPKTIEFLAIAIEAARTNAHAPTVRRHIRKARDLGATDAEIAAVLQMAAALGSRPANLICAN